MGIAEKIKNAKETTWVTEGFSETEINTIIEFAKKSIERKGHTQERNFTMMPKQFYKGEVAHLLDEKSKLIIMFTLIGKATYALFI